MLRKRAPVAGDQRPRAPRARPASSAIASRTPASPPAWRSRNDRWTALEPAAASGRQAISKSGSSAGIEQLVDAAAPEIHEHQPTVGLHDPVLRPRDDPEVLDLDREREFSQRRRLERDPVEVGSARVVAITIALEPPSPTSGGI